MTNRDDASQFINALFPVLPEHGRILIWRVPGRLSDFCKTPDEAAALAVKRAETHDVYIGMGIQPDTLKPAQRGKTDQILGIGGVWADIDFDVDGKKKRYPPDIGAVGQIFKELGLQPTIIVHTGNGVHAHWLFDKPWIFKDSKERYEAQHLVRQWQGTIAHLCGEHGWTIDSTFDLSRVLRPAGTFNRKDKQNPKPVSLLEATDNRYTVDIIEGFILVEDEGVREPVPSSSESVSMSDMPEMAGKSGWDLLPDCAKEYASLDHMTKLWWKQQRFDMKDDSASSYDYAIANLGVTHGWSDKDIAAAMFAWRVEHNKDPDKIYKRGDYVTTTLDRCKASRDDKQEKAPDPDPEPVKPAPVEVEGEVVDKAVPDQVAMQEADRKGYLDFLSRCFVSAKCLGVMKYRIDNTTHEYHMLVEFHGAISDVEIGDVDAITSRTKVKNRLYDEGLMFECKKNDYDLFRQAILFAAEVVENPEVRDTSETVKFLKEYFKKRPPHNDEASWFNAFHRNTAFIHQECLNIDVDTFVNFIFMKYKLRRSNGDMAKSLRRVGFRQTTHKLPDPFNTQWTTFRIRTNDAVSQNIIADTVINPLEELEHQTSA